MSTRPLIGINMEYRSMQGSNPACSIVPSGYYDNLALAGAIPVMIPPIDDDGYIHEILDRVDGMLLIGGPDLDPINDGFMRHESVRPMEVRRESFDRKLMREILERRIPVFGIGVGMQLINLVCGGNLFLHIPIDKPNALPHKDPQDPNHRHTLIIESDSILGRTYGEGEIRVTSRHHMAIDKLADGFRVTGRCPDGIIEAIESEMLDWFAIGTQFHPECNAACKLDIRIFEEFVEGVRVRRGNRQLAEASA